MRKMGCPKCGSFDYRIVVPFSNESQKVTRKCYDCGNEWYYQDDEMNINISEAEKFNDKLSMIIEDPLSYTKDKIEELKKEASKIIHESILQLPKNIKSHSVDRLIECLVTAASLEAYKILLESCRNEVNIRNEIHDCLRR